MHEAAVVDGLIARLERVKGPALRTPIYRALARLWSREKEWDGEWWQTRPDTTGPYFQPVAWAATPRVSDAIRRGLTSESPQVVRALVIDCAVNRVELPEVNERLLAVDPKDSQLAAALLDTMVRRQQLSDTQIAAARKIMQSRDAEPSLRVKTIQVLGWEWAGEAAMEAVADTLAGINASSPAELKDARESFINNPDLARRTGLLSRMATTGPSRRRDVAIEALTAIAESKLTEPKPRAAAEAALAKLRPAATQPATTQSSDSIAAIGLEKSLAVMLKTPGDAARGKTLFTKQGCVACHTVSSADPPKGPFLAGISTRYSRREIIESILTPSAKIAQGFETQWFKVAGGDVIEGFVTRDGGEAIELRDANGKTIVLKKAAIKTRGKRDKSVMPEGLLANLAPDDAANLVAYLESLKGK
jgi:putative heme-binding domain-containing protein